MSDTPAIAVYLYLLGRHVDELRALTRTREFVLSRAQPLPLRALRQAALTDDRLAVGPWVETDDGRALIALWTYAPDHDRALAALPDALRPQAIVHVPVGAVLLWILRAPYPETPADDRPAPDAVLAEIAEALGTIPASAADTLPVPVGDSDLVVLDRDGATDPDALWTWAHEAVCAAREEARQAAEARAATQAETVPSEDANTTTGAGLESIETETPTGHQEDLVPSETADAPAEPDAATCEASEIREADLTRPSATADDGPGLAPAEWPPASGEDSGAAATDGATADGATVPPVGRDADDAAAPPPSGTMPEGDAIAVAAVQAETESTAERVGPGPVDVLQATDRHAPPCEAHTIEGDAHARSAAGPGESVDGDTEIDLPDRLRALLAAAARAQRLSFTDALAEAVLAYALAAVGTREVHVLLDVGLTWKRADGVYALTRDRGWQKLTELAVAAGGPASSRSSE